MDQSTVLRQPSRVTRRRAFAVIAVVSLVAGACGSDGQSPVFDFAERTNRGTLRLLRAGYEFSEAEREQGLLADGWSTPEIRFGDGASFTRAVEQEANLEFLLDEERSWLHFRCWPPALSSGEEQRVEIRVDGESLGTLPLQPSANVYSVPIPAELRTLGTTTVSFRFAHLEPAQQDTRDDTRALGAAFDYVALSSDPEARAPDVISGELDVIARSVEQPAGSELTFSQTIPQQGRLEFGLNADGVAAEVLLRGPDGIDHALTEVSTYGWLTGRYRVDLSDYAGRGMDIVFRTSPDADGRSVTWERPQLFGDVGDTNLATNVLLVVVDTLRADHVGSYGGDAATPNMDALAAAGVRFDRAYTHVPITVPSHSSMFTSLLPTMHGVRSNFQRLSDTHLTLAELLQHNYRDTAAFVSLGVLQANAGLSQGFDEYHDDFGLDWWKPAEEMTDAVLEWSARATGAPFFLWTHYSDPHEPYARPDPTRPTIGLTHAGEPIGAVQVDGDSVALPLIVPPGRTSLVFHTDGPELTSGIRLRALRARNPLVTLSCEAPCQEAERESVYNVELPARFTVRNDTSNTILTVLRLRADQLLDVPQSRRRYLEEVEYADQHLGRLIDGLRDAGHLDDTLVVFTADHGEGLGDHGGAGGIGHIDQLYESQLRIPLMISWPGRLPAGLTVDTPVSLVDLLPTVLDLLAVPDSMTRVGRSLMPLINAEPGMAPAPIVAETFAPSARRDLRAVVVGDHKLILAPESDAVELYDLSDDPHEQTSQAAEDDGRVAALRGILDAELNAAVAYEADDLELTDDELRRLRALGYVR